MPRPESGCVFCRSHVRKTHELCCEHHGSVGYGSVGYGSVGCSDSQRDQLSGPTMKLYDGGRAPNPRRVRIFLAEKGIEVPLVPVNIAALEHKGAEFTAINPYQMLPTLELDDGTVLGESLAICRYFEELQPEPPLFGQGSKGKAEVEMWTRRGRALPLSSCLRCLSSSAPGDGGNAGASNSRMGRGQPDARNRDVDVVRCRTRSQTLPRTGWIFGGGHHGGDHGGFHATGADRGASGARSPEALASVAAGPPELGRLAWIATHR